MKSKEKLQKEKKVSLVGTVIEELPAMLYKVEAIFEYTDEKTGETKAFKPILTCGVSGKMKKMFIQLRKGDEVQLEVSLYNIKNGTITYRNTKRKFIEDNLVEHS